MPELNIFDENEIIHFKTDKTASNPNYKLHVARHLTVKIFVTNEVDIQFGEFDSKTIKPLSSGDFAGFAYGKFKK